MKIKLALLGGVKEAMIFHLWLGPKGRKRERLSGRAVNTDQGQKAYNFKVTFETNKPVTKHGIIYLLYFGSNTTRKRPLIREGHFLTSLTFGFCASATTFSS